MIAASPEPTPQSHPELFESPRLHLAEVGLRGIQRHVEAELRKLQRPAGITDEQWTEQRAMAKAQVLLNETDWPVAELVGTTEYDVLSLSESTTKYRLSYDAMRGIEPCPCQAQRYCYHRAAVRLARFATINAANHLSIRGAQVEVILQASPYREMPDSDFSELMADDCPSDFDDPPQSHEGAD